LDDEVDSAPYLAWRFGLFTGSVVRWYVEGDTEYAAIMHVLAAPAKAGIELEPISKSILFFAEPSSRSRSIMTRDDSPEGILAISGIDAVCRAETGPVEEG